MSLIRTEIKVVKPYLVDAYRAHLANAPAVTLAIVGKTVNRVGEQVLKPLRKEPRGPSYPLRWQSERQRKAYFASNGFGHGIPYRRSNELVNKWALGVVYEDQQIPSITITNPVKYRKFVTGRYQQRMHAGRWYKEEDKFTEARVVLASEVETDLIRLFYVLEPTK